MPIRNVDGPFPIVPYVVIFEIPSIKYLPFCQKKVYIYKV